MGRRWKLILLLFTLISVVLAQNSTDENDDGSYNNDPILQYRPQFARSLPVQILLTGIILTLVAVLFIHLLFTAQYHWPLAQVNYVLQMSGVSTLLISLIATLHVILNQTIRESQEWPYMLSYIAVNMPTTPGEDWSTAERAMWLVMNATTSGLIQITHIQFLTLLYPSRLEARLIFFLLAPLAVVSAVMQLLLIHGNDSVTTIASAVRNVCNATLSLLFTISLLLWGLLVNRSSAWRTDGGTFAFGAAAIILALVSTALNFLYIPSQEEYIWLPGLMWAVVLWQSFLGWWWWVGAGMGIGEVQEMLRREEKREAKRRARLQRRKEQRERARMVWKGMTGAFVRNRRDGGDDGDGAQEQDEVEEDKMSSDDTHVVASPTLATPTAPISSSSSSRTSASSPSRRARSFIPLPLSHLVQKWYGLLRQAHLTAARRQAVERVERIQAVYGREGAGATFDVQAERRPRERPSVVGWGLGSFGIRERERERSRRETQEGSDGEDECGVQGKAGIQMYETNSRRPRPKNEVLDEEARRGSMWWWGPLRKWRLQDSTVY